MLKISLKHEEINFKVFSLVPNKDSYGGKNDEPCQANRQAPDVKELPLDNALSCIL